MVPEPDHNTVKPHTLVEATKTKTVFSTFTGIDARSSSSEYQPFPTCLFS